MIRLRLPELACLLDVAHALSAPAAVMPVPKHRYLLAISLLATTGALAQAPDTSAVQPVRNAVRLDVGVMAVTAVVNILNNALFPSGNQAMPALPVGLSYERAVGRKWSIVGEGAFNGSLLEEKTRGASIQARWYALPSRRKHEILTGVYLAPVVGYRCIDMEQYSLFRARNHVGGYGVMVGIQCHPGHRMSRLLLDVALGAMSWRALQPERIKGMPAQYDISSFPVVDKPYRLQHAGVADARFGVGWAF
jgi:hypothetical protein